MLIPQTFSQFFCKNVLFRIIFYVDEEREALKEDLLDFISRFLRMVELELNFEFNRHGKIRGQMKGNYVYTVYFFFNFRQFSSKRVSIYIAA